MDRPNEYSATNLLEALLLPGFYAALNSVNPDDFVDYYTLEAELEAQQRAFIAQAASGVEAALNRYIDRQLAAPMVPAVRGEDYDPRRLAAIFLDPATSEDELRVASLYGDRTGDDADADTIGTAPNLLAEYCHLLAGGDRAEALALLAVLVGDFDGWAQALAGEDLDTLQRDLKAQAEGERVRHIVKVREPTGVWKDWSKEATLDVEVSTVVAEGETVAEAIRACQLGSPLLEFESPEPWSRPAPVRQVAAEPVRGDLNPYGRPKMSVDDRGSRESEASRALNAINEGMTLLRGGFRSRKGADDTAGQWNAVVRAIRGSEATAAAYFYDYAPKGIPAYADRRAWWRWNDDYSSLSDDKERLPFKGTLYYGAMPETAQAPEPPVSAIERLNQRRETGISAYPYTQEGYLAALSDAYRLSTASEETIARALEVMRNTMRKGSMPRSGYGFTLGADAERAWQALTGRKSGLSFKALLALPRETAPAPEPPVREVAPGVTAYEFSRMQDDDAKRQAAASLVSQLSPRRAPVAEPEPAPAFPYRSAAELLNSLEAIGVINAQGKVDIAGIAQAARAERKAERERDIEAMLRKTFPPRKAVIVQAPPQVGFSGEVLVPARYGYVLEGSTGQTLADTAEEVEQKWDAIFAEKAEAERQRLLGLSDDSFKAERAYSLGFYYLIEDYLEETYPGDPERQAQAREILTKQTEQREGRKKTDKTFRGTRAEVADQMLKAGYFTIIQKPPGGSKEVPLLKNWQGVFEVKPEVFQFAEWLQERRKRDDRASQAEAAEAERRFRTGNPRRRPNPDIGTSMVYGYGINQMTPSAPMGASSAVRSARLAAEAERLAQRLARGRR